MNNFLDKFYNKNPIKTAEQLEKLPANVAERVLEDIAHAKGDDYILPILDHMSVLKIAELLMKRDYSCPSILTWIMSPQIVTNVVKKIPLFWMHVLDLENSSTFFQIQRQALDITVSILLNINQREDQGKILDFLGSESKSLFYLFLPFIDWNVKEEQTILFEDPDVDPGTVDHLFEVIRWASPETAEKILEYVYLKSPSLFSHITDIWMDAYDEIENGQNLTFIEAAMFS